MCDYGFFDILFWTGAGFFTGVIGAQIILDITNEHPNKFAKIAIVYAMIGLVAVSVRSYTDKIIVELIARA